MTPAQKKRFGATSLERIIVGQVNVPCKTQMTVTDLHAIPRNHLRKLARKFSRNTCIRAVLAARQPPRPTYDPTPTKTVCAQNVRGNPARWPEIAELNKLSKENPYRAGDCLKLPAE